MRNRMLALIGSLAVAAAALWLAPQPLAARGESPTAFGRRCIPSGCVAPPSNIPDILGRRALPGVPSVAATLGAPAGRIAALGATPDFHHGLLELDQPAAPR